MPTLLPGPRELYVYYRLRPGAQAPARAAVRAAQAALTQAHAGLTARLLRRTDGPQGSDGETWMETYARPAHPAGVDAALQAAIERTAGAAVVPHLADGRRHVEAFHDDDPQAAPA